MLGDEVEPPGFGYAEEASWLSSEDTSFPVGVEEAILGVNRLFARLSRGFSGMPIVPNTLFWRLFGRKLLPEFARQRLAAARSQPQPQDVGELLAFWVSIVAVLLEHHLAALKIESVPPRGTTFRVSFPLARVEAPGSQNSGTGERRAERDAHRAG
jgi:hypothetical protein